MTEMSRNHAEVIELYCNIDQAIESGELETALEWLEQVYILCGNDSIMLDGLVDYIHDKVTGLLNDGTTERIDRMIEIAEQATKQNEDQEMLLTMASLKGRLYYEAEQYGAAVLIFADLARQAEELHCLELTAEAWHGLGITEHALAHYGVAGGYLRQAAEVFGITGRLQQQAYALYMLGLVELDAGALENALLAQEQAAAILFRLADFAELARVWHEQSLCYLEQGLYEQALAKNDQVIQFYQQQKLDPGRPLSGRVGILFALGEVKKAQELLEECFQPELSDPESGFGEFLRLWRGILLAHSGQLQSAATLIAQSAQFYRNQDYDLEAACHCLAGLYQWLAGEAGQAEAQWQQAVTGFDFRKTQPWLNGLLKRCFKRMVCDFATNDNDKLQLEAGIRKAALGCGFGGE